jgi:hypothetical protein
VGFNQLSFLEELSLAHVSPARHVPATLESVRCATPAARTLQAEAKWSRPTRRSLNEPPSVDLGVGRGGVGADFGLARLEVGLYHWVRDTGGMCMVTKRPESG